MECFCCGEDRDPTMVASLQCHDDIKICRICVGWLMTQAGGVDVTPTLPVADMDAAARFYETAGFGVRRYDDGFAFGHLGDQSVFDLDVIADLDPAANYAGCYIIAADVDAWHARLVAAGLPVTPVEDQPWGMHEFTLTDPSGNHLRIGKGVDE
jgi:catechol 2,3-dioxygenase-like lactoylglutathione lyase family enzyme